MLANFLFIAGLLILMVGVVALGCWYEGKDEREQREWQRDMRREHMNLLRENQELRAAAQLAKGAEK